jgi:uncharacterized protein (DUF2147 family)
MKKIILAFTLLLSITALAQTAADITGNWMIKGMPGMEQLNPEQKQKITDAFKGSVFNFNKDKTYTVNMMGEKDAGTWKMKGKDIEVISGRDKKPAVLKIVKFSKNEIHLSFEGQVLILGRPASK